MASSSSDRNVITRARESSAALSSKDGFSVVAPTSVTVPSSITGRKLSCWARLKRWISSTKSNVPRPVMRRPRAASKTFFRSATPVKIADTCSKARSVAPARRRATVVLPVPGGPQKIRLPSEPGREQPRQRAVRPDEMVLADDLAEGPGPQPVGERAGRLPLQSGGGEEVAHLSRRRSKRSAARPG